MWRIYDRDRSVIKPFFFPALIGKIVAGISLGLIYTYYYEAGDTFVFFQDSLTLSQLARDDFFEYINFLLKEDYSFHFSNALILKEPRSLFFIKIISVTNLFSGDNYWIDGIYLSVFSFWGSYTLVRRIAHIFPASGLAAIFSFMLLPSMMFWTSGMVKESLALGSLFYLSGIVIKTWSGSRIRPLQWASISIALILLWKLKYFYLGVFIPVVATSFITRFLTNRLNIQQIIFQVGIWFVIFIIPFVLVMQLHPNFYPSKMLDVLVHNNEQFNKLSRPDNLITYKELQPTWQSMVINAPWALLSCIFRPVIWEADSILKFIIALENMLLFGGFIMGIFNIRKLTQSNYRLLLLGMCVYILLLAVLLALSAPNFGTLARYRVGFMPFLFILVLSDNKIFQLFMIWLKKWRRGFVAN